jgi:phage terminase large subunit GpA-like protein
MAKLRAKMFAMMAPPPDLTVSQWADAHRVLSSEASSEPGRWNTDRAPYQREMMDVINDDDFEQVVIMTSAQIGKSEILLNAIGYYADQQPCPMLMIQPTLEMAAAFSKDRISGLFGLSPVLKEKVADTRSRSAKAKGAGATVFHKKFAGGHLTLCGANSPASLASRPIAKVFGDEIDRYPTSAGEEGDPMSLARKRTATFHNRKMVWTSTPTVKGASRIELAWEDSDQRRFYVPCPHCGEMGPLWWRNVSWAKDEAGKWDGSEPWYNCEECGSRIEENEKSLMLKRGRWVAESTSNGIAGFHLNELYSPWRKWRDIVADFIAAKDDSDLLRAFVNTSLGETFEEQGETVEHTGLMARREVYAAEVPGRAVCLVAGVDVQDDRLEVTIWGAAPDHERFAISHRQLWGDPGFPEVWNELDEIILHGEFVHESGNHLRVSATAVDSGGHHTKRVYEYCMARRSSRVYAIKGVGGFGRPAVSAPSGKRSGRDRRKIDLWALGVDEIKSGLYSRLNIDQAGPGFVHFPLNDEFDEEFFAQLTAEKIVTKFKRGVPYREWVSTRRRNEALDCAVYAEAALTILNPSYPALARRLTAEPEASTEPKEPIIGRTRGGKRTPRRGGFVKGWK